MSIFKFISKQLKNKVVVNKNLIPVLYIFSVVILFIGALLKILHQPFSIEMMGLAFLSAITYIILSLIEIFKSDRIDTSEKIMWLFGFIFLGTIAGFIYLVSGRKRVLRKFKLNI